MLFRLFSYQGWHVDFFKKKRILASYICIIPYRWCKCQWVHFRMHLMRTWNGIVITFNTKYWHMHHKKDKAKQFSWAETHHAITVIYSLYILLDLLSLPLLTVELNEIRDMLKDPELQKMILQIDGSSEPEKVITCVICACTHAIP
jgi:hypothetical protein